MDRRQLLKLIAMGLVGTVVDVDELLWIPGEKTIFIPELKRLSAAEIVAAELERLQPKIRTLFDRSDEFYTRISKRGVEAVSSRGFIIPLDGE